MVKTINVFIRQNGPEGHGSHSPAAFWKESGGGRSWLGVGSRGYCPQYQREGTLICGGRGALRLILHSCKHRTLRQPWTAFGERTEKQTQTKTKNESMCPLGNTVPQTICLAPRSQVTRWHCVPTKYLGSPLPQPGCREAQHL